MAPDSRSKRLGFPAADVMPFGLASLPDRNLLPGVSAPIWRRYGRAIQVPPCCAAFFGLHAPIWSLVLVAARERERERERERK